ncbi:transposase family protein [Streptomyces sp. NPDC056921]|uniref:helix-turn-helix domain-containing protein n=1 Tax=Streptomyces sp. NPDC056921 TaxID=3345966 RepID=UPI003635647D
MIPRQFGKPITALRREGADPVRKGRPWSLSLEDRVLLIAAYRRTNLTLRQLAPLFGISKSAADRIIDHLGPSLALQPRQRFRKDVTTRSPRSRRITGARPTTRSSSTPTPSSSSRSAGRCPATAMTARRGSCPARKPPSAAPR